MTHSERRAARRQAHYDYDMRDCAAFAAQQRKRVEAHTTGYRVHLFGLVSWHRTVEGARRRAGADAHWYDGKDNKIVDCATGKQVKYEPPQY